MLIRKVHIENFKRWEVLDAVLKPLDCLVGPNNSGKTTLLQALALFDFGVHHCLSGKNGGLEIKGRSISPEDFYVIPCANPVDLWTNRKTQAASKHKIIKILVTFENALEATVSVDLTYNRFGVSLSCSDDSPDALQSLRQLRTSYLPVFSTFLTQEERKTPAVIEDALARGRVNSVIRNLLLNLKRENRQHLLLEVLRRIFPNLAEINIEFDEANDRYISFTYLEKGRPKEFDVFMAGSGFQQFVYLFGFIHLRQPTVILFDEPDAHLHGSLQHALLSELQHLVANGCQILFATHSREMITRIDPSNILSIEDAGAKRLALAFDVYDTLDSLGSVDPTQLATIQAYRRVLVVENQSDWDLLSIFCEKCLPPEVWPEVQRRLAVCYARGNPWKQDVDRLRHQLQQMIAVQGASLELFVVADRDYHPDLSVLRAGLPATNILWHVWERAEIENYLLNSDGIVRVMHKPENQMTLDEGALRSEMDRLIEQSKNAANDRLVKAFDELRRKLGEHWDPVTLSRKAREYVQAHWDADRIALADAKEIVLPGIKRWLQAQHHGQFSDRSLAEALTPQDLAPEIHDVTRALARFAGVSLPST
ncbi:MAG: AAA family ATPase [Verrucomicrobia bacterium]|nr:AAA family ATPase [Verrucomicrobiota bacterium]